MKNFVLILAAILSLTACSKKPTVESEEPVQKVQLPYAKTVDGKPGFVVSPYAPDQGYIDVRGFPRDTEVKDPYSQKVFLVP